MPHTHALLNKALSLDFIQGKGHLARLLEMGHPQLNQILKGKRALTTRQCIILAETLGMQPLDVINLNGVDTAKTDAEREWWHRRVPRFLATVAGLALAVNTVTVGTSKAGSYSTELGRQTIHYANCIM
jgi:plasmid maintenance system antidote protein VapI